MRAIWIAALVTVVPVLLAYPIAYIEAQRLVQDDVLLAAQTAVSQVDHILEKARAVSVQASPLIGLTCASAERQLRRLTVAAALVRSTNLVVDGVIYCTSVEGQGSSPEEADRYVDGSLRLMPNNRATPDSPVLIYRRPSPAGSVLVGISGEHLRDVLALVGRENVTSSLTVGGMTIDQTGTVRHLGRPSTTAQNSASAVSIPYPFAVSSVAKEGALLDNLTNRYASVLALAVGLGGIASLAVYRGQRYRHAPSQELARALKAGEFVAYYQPVFVARTGEICGVEVLMRWHNPIDGLIPADHFIPFAERDGIIVAMTEHIVRQCQEDLATVADRLSTNFHVGFNISPAHLQSTSLVGTCRDFLRSFTLGQVVLMLELTERNRFDFDESTLRLFSQLRALGVEFAIDDFGTGHSGLSYVQDFHFDYLKIDRIFVSGCDKDDSNSKGILLNIIDLAKRLQIRTIAEGVEEAGERDELIRLGVDCLQGYLLGRPVPIDQLIPILPLGRIIESEGSA